MGQNGYAVPTYGHGCSWTGRGGCTLGFPWARRWWAKIMTKSVNYTRLARRWTGSVFLWDDHQAAISVPSLDFEDSSGLTEAVANDARRAVNDSSRSISLSSTEPVCMGRDLLQNYMALDVLTPAQGGTYVIIKTQCCINIPDNAADVCLALRAPHEQICILSNPELSFSQWLSSWFVSWGIW